jgi:hypothetical protein
LVEFIDVGVLLSLLADVLHKVKLILGNGGGGTNESDRDE